MTNNTDPVRALIAPKLDMIISGYRINQDDADWLRGLLHRASAPPSAPVGVDWPTIVEGLRLADHFFDGDDHYWQPASKVRAAYLAALAAQQQGGA